MSSIKCINDNDKWWIKIVLWLWPQLPGEDRQAHSGFIESVQNLMPNKIWKNITHELFYFVYLIWMMVLMMSVLSLSRLSKQRTQRADRRNGTDKRRVRAPVFSLWWSTHLHHVFGNGSWKGGPDPWGSMQRGLEESTESTKLLIRPKGVQQFYSVLVYYRSLVLAWNHPHQASSTTKWRRGPNQAWHSSLLHG